MRKLIFLFISIVSFLNINAQSTIVTFTAKDFDDNHLQLDSVLIIDVTREWTKTIYYPDTSIDLFYVGITSHNNRSENLVLSQNVPNPCQGTTSIDLYLPNNENVLIEISDVLGRVITSFERILEQGNHKFELTLEACQMYLLTAKTQTATSSIKIMNTQKSGLSSCILYKNTVSASTPVQKSNIQKFFLPGDSMIYIGYYQDKIKTINKKQNQNETIVFHFSIGNYFVDILPQNKNILLEEYTGVNCGYGPDGDRISDQLHATYVDKFLAINIHAGSYSGGYFNTPEGNALNAAFKIIGYPSGVISRELINTGTKVAFGVSKTYWEDIVSQIMALKAYVNVAARSTIDSANRRLTCEVQAYFTDSSVVTAGLNFINIAIVQNNIWGSQNGASNYPEMYDVNTGKYKHNHMLRTLITGLDGEAMPENKKGTFYRKIFTYTIPETISNETVVLKDLEIIVFVTQNTPSTIPANMTNPDTEMPRVINVCKSELIFE
ncbi:MAG: Outer membrane protein Omp28 [Bacteroidetes bacterium ADurb.Bin234]|nr:MAG: Outer membrane protein Omp28 [Bacteroidetes bacterium ADurb.Bin234]